MARDELALELERQVPDEAQQDGAHVVVAQQQLPQRLGEIAAERVLLELPDDGLRAVVDEHLAQRLRAVQQPLVQQAELLLEDLERLAALELLDLALRRLERAARLAIALEIVAFGAPGLAASIRMNDLRVTVGRDTGRPAPAAPGVILTRSSAPGMRWPTSFVTPSTTIVVFSNSSLRS